MNERKLDQILDDLRWQLMDEYEGLSWGEVVEMSVDEAWEALLRLEP